MCIRDRPYTDKSDIVSIIIEIHGYGSTSFGGKVYSVEDMNSKKAVWLVHENTFFEGGDTLREVFSKIEEFNNNSEEYNKIYSYIRREDKE